MRGILCRIKILLTPEMAQTSERWWWYGEEKGEKGRNCSIGIQGSKRVIFFLTTRLSCVDVCSAVWFLVLFKRGVFVRGLPLINEKSINGRMARNSEERQNNKRKTNSDDVYTGMEERDEEEETTFLILEFKTTKVEMEFTSGLPWRPSSPFLLLIQITRIAKKESYYNLLGPTICFSKVKYWQWESSAES